MYTYLIYNILYEFHLHEGSVGPYNKICFNVKQYLQLLLDKRVRLSNARKIGALCIK